MSTAAFGAALSCSDYGLLRLVSSLQCIIDLKHGVLEIGTTGTKTPFLSEGDVPEHARLNRPGGEPEDEDRQLAEALNKSAREGEPLCPLPAGMETKHL